MFDFELFIGDRCRLQSICGTEGTCDFSDVGASFDSSYAFSCLPGPEAVDLLEIEKLPVFREPDGDPTIRHESRIRHCAATCEGQPTLYGFWS